MHENHRTAAIGLSPVTLIGVLLAIGLCACSGTQTKQAATARGSTDAASVASAAASPAEMALLTHADADKDNDHEAIGDDTNNNTTLDFGHPADPAEQRAIVSLVKRFYRVALAEQGAKACAMLYSTIAEATPEDFGSFAGPAYMHGKTCPEILTKQFAHFHALLAIELPKLKITRVRLEEHHGRAILSFGPRLPERELPVQREGHTWRIAALLDGELS